MGNRSGENMKRREMDTKKPSQMTTGTGGNVKGTRGKRKSDKMA